MSESQSVYIQLSSATGVAFTPSDKKEEYFKKLALAIDGVDEAVWNGFTDEAQKWYNDVVVALQKKAALPEIPGGLPVVQEASSVEKAASTEKKSKERVTKSTVVTPPPTSEVTAPPEGEDKSTSPTPTKVKSGKGRGENSVMWKVKEEILSYPAESLESLEKRLGEKGVKVSHNTLLVTRPDFLQTLRLLQSKNLLSKNLVEG